MRARYQPFSLRPVSDATERPPLVAAVDAWPKKAACIVFDINISAKHERPDRIVGDAKTSCGGTYDVVLQGECMADCADGHAGYFGRSGRAMRLSSPSVSAGSRSSTRASKSVPLQT